MSETGDPNAPAHPGWFWAPQARSTLMAAAITLVVDQAHKLWMLLVLGIQEGTRFALLPFLDIVYVRNTGISYSLLDGDSQTWQLTLAWFAGLAALGMWIWAVRGQHSKITLVSLGLIIGGAVANAIDRVWLGGVADFFSLHAYGFYWYVFNLADVAIVAGVTGLLYDSFVASRNDAVNGA